MSTYILLYVAGLVTILNPCVLPLLPVIIASAFYEGILAPISLILGLVVSFSILATLILLASFSLGFNADISRLFGGYALLFFGLCLVNRTVNEIFSKFSSIFTNNFTNLSAEIAAKGYKGQFGLGILLGIVWIPCAGPVLGAAITFAAKTDTILQSVLMMFVFSLGTAVPLLLLAYGSRILFHNYFAHISIIGRLATKVMGWSLMLVGGGIITGLDRKLEAGILDFMPFWLIQFTTSF